MELRYKFICLLVVLISFTDAKPLEEYKYDRRSEGSSSFSSAQSSSFSSSSSGSFTKGGAGLPTQTENFSSSSSHSGASAEAGASSFSSSESGSYSSGNGVKSSSGSQAGTKTGSGLSGSLYDNFNRPGIKSGGSHSGSSSLASSQAGTKSGGSHSSSSALASSQAGSSSASSQAASQAGTSGLLGGVGGIGGTGTSNGLGSGSYGGNSGLGNYETSTGGYNYGVNNNGGAGAGGYGSLGSGGVDLLHGAQSTTTESIVDIPNIHNIGGQTQLGYGGSTINNGEFDGNKHKVDSAFGSNTAGTKQVTVAHELERDDQSQLHQVHQEHFGNKDAKGTEVHQQISGIKENIAPSIHHAAFDNSEIEHQGQSSTQSSVKDTPHELFAGIKGHDNSFGIKGHVGGNIKGHGNIGSLEGQSTTEHVSTSLFNNNGYGGIKGHANPIKTVDIGNIKGHDNSAVIKTHPGIEGHEGQATTEHLSFSSLDNNGHGNTVKTVEIGGVKSHGGSISKTHGLASNVASSANEASILGYGTTEPNLGYHVTEEQNNYFGANIGPGSHGSASGSNIAAPQQTIKGNTGILAPGFGEQGSSTSKVPDITLLGYHEQEINHGSHAVSKSTTAYGSSNSNAGHVTHGDFGLKTQTHQIKGFAEHGSGSSSVETHGIGQGKTGEFGGLASSTEIILAGNSGVDRPVNIGHNKAFGGVNRNRPDSLAILCGSSLMPSHKNNYPSLPPSSSIGSSYNSAGSPGSHSTLQSGISSGSGYNHPGSSSASNSQSRSQSGNSFNAGFNNALSASSSGSFSNSQTKTSLGSGFNNVGSGISSGSFSNSQSKTLLGSGFSNAGSSSFSNSQSSNSAGHGFNNFSSSGAESHSEFGLSSSTSGSSSSSFSQSSSGSFSGLDNAAFASDMHASEPVKSVKGVKSRPSYG